MTDLINIPTLFTSLIIAVVTAALSVYWAIKKYRSEKWWEVKVECYINCVAAMNDIIRFCDNILAEQLNDGDMPEDLRRKLRNDFRKGKAVLETQTNIGHLLLSEKAYEDLRSLDGVLTASEQEMDMTKVAADVRVATEECLFKFIPHAKNDLKVGKL